jgi:hypothetical protein
MGNNLLSLKNLWREQLNWYNFCFKNSIEWLTFIILNQATKIIIAISNVSEV